MDGLNQLTAADHTVEIGGRTYRLGPLTLRDYGEIENRVVSQRPDPVAVALRSLEGLSPRQQEFLLGRAYDRAVSTRRATAAEVDQWKRTPEGFCYLFWLMVRKGHPKITLKRAAELVEQLAGEVRQQLGRRMEGGRIGNPSHKLDCDGLPVGNPSSQAQPTATSLPPTMPRYRGRGGPAR